MKPNNYKEEPPADIQTVEGQRTLCIYGQGIQKKGEDSVVSYPDSVVAWTIDTGEFRHHLLVQILSKETEDFSHKFELILTTQQIEAFHVALTDHPGPLRIDGVDPDTREHAILCIYPAEEQFIVEIVADFGAAPLAGPPPPEAKKAAKLFTATDRRDFVVDYWAMNLAPAVRRKYRPRRIMLTDDGIVREVTPVETTTA